MFEFACSAGIDSRHTERMWVMRLSVKARDAVAATILFSTITQTDADKA